MTKYVSASVYPIKLLSNYYHRRASHLTEVGGLAGVNIIDRGHLAE